MFIGTYYHTLEASRRVSIPKAFRSSAKQWIITRGLDGGLFLFTKEQFQSSIKAIEQRTFTSKTHRDFARLLANEAQTLQPDKQGRVQLPEYLTAFANIKHTIVFAGSIDYIEIWDRDIYHSYLKQIENKAEDISEALITPQRSLNQKNT